MHTHLKQDFSSQLHCSPEHIGHDVGDCSMNECREHQHQEIKRGSACMSQMCQHSNNADLYLRILFVLNSHHCTVFSPGCNFQFIWYTVLCNHQAVVSCSQERVRQTLQGTEQLHWSKLVTNQDAAIEDPTKLCQEHRQHLCSYELSVTADT